MSALSHARLQQASVGGRVAGNTMFTAVRSSLRFGCVLFGCALSVVAVPACTEEPSESSLTTASLTTTATGASSSATTSTEESSTSEPDASSTSDATSSSLDTLTTDTTHADSSASSDSSSTMPASCDGPYVCAQAVPMGWEGPMAEYVANDPSALPSCPGEYPTLSFDLFSGLIAPPATCTGCTFAAKPTACELRYGYTDANECDGKTVSETQVLQLDTCQSFTSLQEQLNGAAPFVPPPRPAIRFLSPQAVGGAICEPVQPGEIALEPVRWETSHRLCTGTPALPKACEEGETCVLKPYLPATGQVCIAAPGDVQCPEGAYSQRRVLYRSLDDQRECSACTAAPLGETICNFELEFFAAQPDDDGNLCRAAVKTEHFPEGDQGWEDACYVAGYDALKHNVSAKEISEPTFNGTCETTGWQPQGQALPTQPMTICCTP